MLVSPAPRGLPARGKACSLRLLDRTPVVDFLTQLKAALADRYTIERELGRGGMATVFLARDLKHHRPVALKVLHPQIAALLGSERFLREIETAASLNHPHILPLFDSGTAGPAGSGTELLWYTMPPVEGESLRDLLNRERQVSMDRAVRIARDVAGALAHAHARGIVHRDIKPENILLAGDHALVADFGIAKALNAAGGGKLTETGLAIGTAAYMSPEQASGERDLDGRSDIYALGCVLYEMLAGHPPFAGPTAQSVLARHAIDPVPSLHTGRQEVPATVDRAVKRALAKVPADRFATAAQFAQALTSEEDTAVTSRVRVTPHPGLRGRRITTGIVLSLAAGVIGWYLLRPRPTVGALPESTIAVLPISPSVADTGLIRLGRDLVVTLSANLDGVGDIRTVDANTILTQTAKGPIPLSLEDAAAVARRLGAGRVLHGSLVRTGAGVRIELGLFDTKDLAPKARSALTASPDDPVGITDSMTSSILAQIWEKGPPPSPSLAAVTTHSMPALRAFLDGERLLVQGDMDSAAGAYRHAFTADTTFWLAYFRYAYVFNWTERSGADSLADIAWEHRAALPERERLLLEIPREDRLSVRLRRSQEFVDRYPDYWPGWFQYADYLVHGDGTGYTLDNVVDALERTVELNPDVTWAWEHLFKLTLTLDTPKAGRALAEMKRLVGSTNPRIRPFYLPAYRLLLQAAVASPVSDTALMDSVARTLATQPLNFTVGGLDFTLAFVAYGFASTQIDFNRRVLRYVVDRDLIVNLHIGTATTWAARGAWDSMQPALDQVIASAPKTWGADPAWQAYRYNVFGVWLGALNPSVALTRRRAMREAATRPPGLSPAYELAFLPWLDGLQADATRDEISLRLARETLRADTFPSARSLGRSLAAFELGLAGNYREAADSMVALIGAVTEGACCKGTFDDVNRLAASRWLLAVGDTVMAGEIIGQLEVDHWHPVFSGPMHLARARIHQALRRTEEARSDYIEFLRRLDMPSASQRHLVDEARIAIGPQDPPQPR